jgi:hypothetical protein
MTRPAWRQTFLYAPFFLFNPPLQKKKVEETFVVVAAVC